MTRPPSNVVKFPTDHNPAVSPDGGDDDGILLSQVALIAAIAEAAKAKNEYFASILQENIRLKLRIAELEGQGDD